MQQNSAMAVTIDSATVSGTAARVAATTARVRPLLTRVCLVGADAAALGICLAISAGCRMLAPHHSQLTQFARLWPLFFVFLSVFAGLRLYSLVGLSAPEELRRSTVSSILLLLVLIAVSVSSRGAEWNREWPLFLAVALSLVFVPLLRAVVRIRFGRKHWWGHPAIVVGLGQGTRTLVREMRNDAALGLKPVAIIEDRDAPGEFDGLPVFGTTADPTALRELASPYVIAAVADIPQHRVVQMVKRRHLRFSGILLVQDTHAFSSLHINLRRVGGMFALEVPPEHVMRYRQLAKRVLDVSLTLTIAVPAAPLAVLTAIAIKLSSPGPVLYGQRRIGRHGEEFRAWKFRSMVGGGDQILREYLANNPEAQREWDASHKLKNDPRVTRTGAFLRKTSLDEIPQLWNVLLGQMSIVGPRPIVQAEVERYGDTFDLYKSVRGGLTGLWQVSGRNDTSYEDRVRLDRFYVQNCSVWLDLCILFRTLGVVLLKKGAY